MISPTPVALNIVYMLATPRFSSPSPHLSSELQLSPKLLFAGDSQASPSSHVPLQTLDLPSNLFLLSSSRSGKAPLSTLRSSQKPEFLLPLQSITKNNHS